MITNNIFSFLKTLCYAIFGLLILINHTFADEFADNFQFNGFFTLDATITDQDLALISNSDNTVAYDANSLSFKNSLIGAQLSYSFTDNFTAVMQAKLYDKSKVSSSDETSLAQIDWAYISYDLGADLKARAGRFLVPFMQGTELRSVGFSRLWARPLIPNSGAGGYKEFIGVELLKHFAMGEGNWDFQLSLGQGEHDLERIKNKHIEVFSIRYQQDSFWIRSAVLSTQYDIYTQTNNLIKDSATALMFSTELEYTLQNFVFNGGYTQSKTDITPDNRNIYLSLAYNFDPFIPYVFHARSNQHFDLFDLPVLNPPNNGIDPQNPSSSMPLPPPPPMSLERPEGDLDIYHWALGVRYNFSERYALKFQLEHINEDNKANFKTEKGEGNALTIVLEGIF